MEKLNSNSEPNKPFRFVDNCAYINCHKGRFINGGTHLFCFPMKKDSRCKIWIQCSGNTVALQRLAPSTFLKCGLCSDHFSSDSFVDEKRMRLKRSAVPIPYENEKIAKDNLWLTAQPWRYNEECNTEVDLHQITQDVMCTRFVESNLHSRDSVQNLMCLNKNATDEVHCSFSSSIRACNPASLTFNIDDNDIFTWTSIEPLVSYAWSK